jgi:hypothetical protein
VEPLEIEAGESVSCAVEGATDVDHWVVRKPDNSIAEEGNANDAITYKWSCPSGSQFSDGSQEVTGQSATWKAPNVTQAQNFTLSCVIDDEGLEGDDLAPETGTRQDGIVTRSVTVRVVPDSSKASRAVLKVYPSVDGKPGAEKSPIGGKVLVALEVMVAPTEKLASTSCKVRLEEPDPLHTSADNHVDVDLSLATAKQKSTDGGENWSDTEESMQTINGSGQPVYYRTWFDWDTIEPQTGANSKLWDHNGQYVIGVTAVDGDASKREVLFKPAVGVNYSSGPNNIGTTVQNLVLVHAKANSGTQLENDDYFVYEPESDLPSLKSPVISFSFADDGDRRANDTYGFSLLLVNAITGDSHLFESTQLLNSSELQAIQPQQNVVLSLGNKVPRGAYGFDISVEKFRDGELFDQEFLRSELDFSKTQIQTPVANNNDVESDSTTTSRAAITSQGRIRLLYKIGTPTEATNDPLVKVMIDILDPDSILENRVSGKTETGVEHEKELPLWVKLDKAGPRRIIVVGKESPHKCRNHVSKSVLAKGTVGVHYVVKVIVGAGMKPIARDGHPSTELGWRDQLNLVTKTPVSKVPVTMAFWPVDLPLQSRHTAADIWNRLADALPYRREGESAPSWWHPVLVNVKAHGGVWNSNVGNEKEEPHSVWKVGQSPPPETTDVHLLSARRLNGIHSINMMSCFSGGDANTVTGTRQNYIPNTQVATATPIAPYIAHYKGAINSVGFARFIEFNDGNPDREPGQAWYDSYYRIGLSEQHNFSSRGGLIEVEKSFTSLLNEWGIAGLGSVNLGTSANFGFDHWVVSYPNQPLIDY